MCCSALPLLRFTWGGEGFLFLLGTYGVGVGGVQVGADNALLLDVGEDLLGDRVGEWDRHVVGCGCVLVWVWWCMFGSGCLGGNGKVATLGGKLL